MDSDSVTAEPAGLPATFSDATRAWFASAFAAPTPAQLAAWQATAAGESVLVSAPTGSGKTLAAFLAALDGLFSAPDPPAKQKRTSVLYVSPMKALAYDVDRNLRAPLVGITRAAQRLGQIPREITVGMRTGDTPANERQRLARTPPDILITTPESLFLMLTSRARQALASVSTVIIDEVHAVATTKRGAHLAVSLERLQHLVSQGGGPLMQRVGLSATQRPLPEIGRFLSGGTVTVEGSWAPRPVTIADVPSDKELDLQIVVPVEDMAAPGQGADNDAGALEGPGSGESGSIWTSVQPKILELVEQHRSTIIFANSRRLAERLCARLNELHAEGSDHGPIARAHHGSVSREERVSIEEALKAGRLRCVVATSSLELGIDMGAVDLVIQVESPGSVASGLQRVGRAGHQVSAPSVGRIFPKYRADLVECAVVVQRMRTGEIEHSAYLRTPLDVLAQQVVAMAAMDAWKVDDLHLILRQAAGFADLSRTQLDGVLDMLSGRYPSDEFAELRPRINWDRVADEITGRAGAQRLAVTSGGTIPDRGLYGVFLASGAESDGGRTSGARGAPRRVGELDEEMVYETRPGETVILGASAWRVEDITRDQVLVTPAPGEPGKLPFWHGDSRGRPVEVGRAVGSFLREIGQVDADAAVTTLSTDYDLDPLAAGNLTNYLSEQREATGVLPDDTTLVIERFRDEIGDWRVVVHSPFGGQVHAPWALAIQARTQQELGLEVATMTADDGIVIRFPDVDDLPTDAELRALLLPESDDVEDLVVGQLADSALFAARFRECAARALLLPRRAPGTRTPLWQQRQRAADLLSVASRYGGFPILLETYRECLQDVFDVPALTDLLRGIERREIRMVEVETPLASPFASALLFDYVATYMYEGDAPLAERRAQALALDRELLAELLGSEELRDLIDADALDELELELQHLTSDRLVRSPDAVHDLLRRIGDLTTAEVGARVEPKVREQAPDWLADLERQRRVYRLRIAGQERWAAAEDAARFRDALGAPPVLGLPEAFLEDVDRPTVDLVARFARTHGPFEPHQVCDRLGLPLDAVRTALGVLETDGRVVTGEFRPNGTSTEWVDAQVLRRIRRRSLAKLRHEVEPVEPEALARFLPGWQGVGSRAPGVDRVFEVVDQLAGAPIPASVLERDVLGSRVSGYQPAWLDELCAAGEVFWIGRGALGTDDGRVSLHLRDVDFTSVPPPPSREVLASHDWWTARHAGLLDLLESQGAAFWPALQQAMGDAHLAEQVTTLWDLVWAGVVTNDVMTPVRGLAEPQTVRRNAPRRGRRGRRPPRALARTGPVRTTGRWSLVRQAIPAADPTERASALVTQLLDRHGVVTRDAVASESVPGGFSALYPVLAELEGRGRVRRGYFVEGLGGAQFALPGAVDRLRASGDLTATVVLAATDPANPYGAALPWPAAAGSSKPRRVAGAYLVLTGGRPVCFVERGGRSLVTFDVMEPDWAAVAEALTGLIDARSVDRLSIQRVNGEDDASHPVIDALRAAGFTDTPRGLVRRAP